MGLLEVSFMEQDPLLRTLVSFKTRVKFWWDKELLIPRVIEFRDEFKNLHRVNYPALYSFDKQGLLKNASYYFKGVLHNTNGPASINFQDNQIIKEYYYYHGETHNLKGPAIIEYKNNNENMSTIIVSKKYYIMGVELSKREWLENEAVNNYYRMHNSKIANNISL